MYRVLDWKNQKERRAELKISEFKTAIDRPGAPGYALRSWATDKQEERRKKPGILIVVDRKNILSLDMQVLDQHLLK